MLFPQDKNIAPIDKQQWENEILEERIMQASDTIANQNALLTGFGILYNIITVTIALIAIALPILTYQFGIKPSQNALKEFEKNIDKKILDFLNRKRDEQIEEAIENLKSQNRELQSNAILFLSFSQYQKFSDQQLFKIFKLLNSGELDSADEGAIAYSVSNQQNEYATEYFTKAVEKVNPTIKYAAIRYFAITDIKNYLPVLKKIIADASKRDSEYFALVVHLSNISKKVAFTILNSREIIDILSSEDLISLKPLIPSIEQQLLVAPADLEGTYLIKRINRTAEKQGI